MPFFTTRSVLFLTLLFTVDLVQAQSFQDASGLLPPAPDLVPLGASMVDVNNDGRIDIHRRGVLYVQQEDGTFLDMFEQLGLDEAGGIVFGGIFGDYDNDGFVDVFFMDLLSPSKLYRNHAGLGFVQTNSSTGILEQAPVQGSLWTDFNQDGRIDLFVGIDGGISNLFMNGEDHVFSNVSEAAGIEYRAVYGVAAADFDRDGDSDIFLTQCFAPLDSDTADNVLYQQENGIFQNVSPAMGIVDDLPSWGAVWLDYNNDGWLDIFTVNLYSPQNGATSGLNTLYRNNEGRSFTDVSEESGIQGPPNAGTIATAAADFDNDGWVDLIVVDRANMPAQFYRNKGDGTFEDITDNLGVVPGSSQAVSAGDLNNDGWIDLIIPADSREQVLVNNGGDFHYLKVHARGTTANRFGIGARIDLYAGGLQQVREITAGDGMTSQNHNLSAHFGLGETSQVDSLVVSWPGGHVDRLQNIAADTEITIVEGIGINNPPAPALPLLPADAVSPAVEDGALPFTWTAATDPEQDDLAYTLYLQGPGLEMAFPPVDSLSLSVPASIFTQGASYRWTVATTDGYSIRTGGTFSTFVFGNSTAVDDAVPPSNPALEISSTYPNPFVSSVVLNFRVHHTSYQRIVVYDLLGRAITTLAGEVYVPGTYEVSWDGRDGAGVDVGPGSYILQIQGKTDQTSTLVFRR